MRNSFRGDFDFTITDISLIHKFIYTANTTYSMYSNGRKMCGLVYCISGSALYRFENQQLLLKSGRILFLPKNSVYTIENQSDSDFQHFTVNFEFSGLEFDNIEYEDISDTFGAYEMLERLIGIWTEKKHGYRPIAKAVLYELLYKYFINLKKIHRSEEYRKISPAKHFLDNHYCENTPISVLAKSCGFSETHFRRTFSKVFNCSPTEYRLKKRILLAKELLNAGELSVLEIASYVGFDDSSYFSRVFKSETGTTPTKYAKTNGF